MDDLGACAVQYVGAASGAAGTVDVLRWMVWVHVLCGRGVCALVVRTPVLCSV